MHSNLARSLKWRLIEINDQWLREVVFKVRSSVGSTLTSVFLNYNLQLREPVIYATFYRIFEWAREEQKVILQCLLICLLSCRTTSPYTYMGHRACCITRQSLLRFACAFVQNYRSGGKAFCRLCENECIEISGPDLVGSCSGLWLGEERFRLR